MSSGFGQLPNFANLSAADLTDLLQRLQQTPQDPRDTGPQAGSQGVPPEANGLGALVSGGHGAPLAMNEDDVRRLERQQAAPADLAALGGNAPQFPGGLSPDQVASLRQIRDQQAAPNPGSPDALLYDRSGMGGGPNGFTGSADPYGSRPVPLPPARPSDDALSAQPATTGTVSGMNPDASAGPQRRVVASTNYHPDLASSNPTGGRPAAAADYRGGPNDLDLLTGRLLGGSQPVAPSQAGASTGVPAAQGAGAPGAPQPSMMERFATALNHPDVSNLLLNVGIGLMSQRGFGPGIASGLQNFQQSRLGDVKNALEQLKLQQTIQGQQATYGSLRKAGFSHEQATAGMYNPTMLSNLLQQQNQKPNIVDLGGIRYLVPPNAANDQSQWQRIGAVNGPQPGFEADPNNPGGERPIVGSQADPNYKGTVAGAEAKARNDATPSKPILARPGTVVLDGDTHQPLYTAPGNKPEGFETEDKLRTEFSKQLGTFSQVHDGYGRVIAATKQREANPNAVSPASDIGLVFGFMKMLDPGSVVREGEYATAKNAAGVPERVLNAYNKALNGEFLSTEQRKDFLGQAAELYGTARKTADGVADRYRGLATQYGVSPDRSVYLPEMPTPPKLGASASQTTPDIPQGAPTGTRRAPDGNLYAPDPARPGKYLQVR